MEGQSAGSGTLTAGSSLTIGVGGSGVRIIHRMSRNDRETSIDAQEQPSGRPCSQDKHAAQSGAPPVETLLLTPPPDARRTP